MVPVICASVLDRLICSWLNWAAFCGCVLVGWYVITIAFLVWFWWTDRREISEEEILRRIARRADRWPFH